MTCSNCGGELTSGTGIDYMGTHARHSSRSDCIDVKNQRIAALEAQLAAERARVAELEADRERLRDTILNITARLPGLKSYPEEVSDLVEDRKRLEKLVRNAWTVRLDWAEYFVHCSLRGRLTENYKDWREAIDAAREAAKG